MPSISPWAFTPGLKANLVVFYGADLAMSLSLAQCYKAVFCEDIQPEDCYEGIFDSACDSIIKTITDKPEKIIKLYSKESGLKKCILIYPNKNLVETQADGILYVKCDPLTAPTRALFIKAHCKRLGIESPKEANWVKNLNDLILAVYSEKFSINYNENKASESIWVEIFMNKCRHKAEQKSIWTHFELWAKENSPSDKALWFFMQNVRSQIKKNSA